MRRGIFVAPFDELSDPGLVAKLAVRAEERGWDGFFVWDHIDYRPPVSGVDALPDQLRSLMRDVGAPSGVAELGYTEDDVPALVEGALKQQRLLVIAPREAGPNELAGILRASL